MMACSASTVGNRGTGLRTAKREEKEKKQEPISRKDSTLEVLLQTWQTVLKRSSCDKPTPASLGACRLSILAPHITDAFLSFLKISFPIEVELGDQTIVTAKYNGLVSIQEFKTTALYTTTFCHCTCLIHLPTSPSTISGHQIELERILFVSQTPPPHAAACLRRLLKNSRCRCHLHKLLKHSWRRRLLQQLLNHCTRRRRNQQFFKHSWRRCHHSIQRIQALTSAHGPPSSSGHIIKLLVKRTTTML